ncbi:activated RNA polymerase II transcriptional coactivator p15 [Venturia canescens]|uniref:activated RNA polymerase II transcriptional coactivator p15 n=1 Tax=Venturia canescens TaxID=32260 RepID=UPI001C9CE042|nr:activated RNA polymerase II transcriptional coactivator p15 [Venturia canescens]
MLIQRSFQVLKNIQTTVLRRYHNFNDPSFFYDEMPKTKEFVSSSNDSESEEERPVKRKREEKKEKVEKAAKAEKAESSKKSKKSSKDEEEDKWDIGNNRFVTVREFKGKMYVDIREMYVDKEGELKPGKKGIAMNMMQWRKFMDQVEEIDKVAKDRC